MRVLAVDVGSSTVKASVVVEGRVASRVSSAPVRTDLRPPRVEVHAEPLFRSVVEAIRGLGSALRNVDRIAIDALSPSVVLLDRTSRPITPFITHQDRRSLEEARWLEARFGRRAHLRRAGNRPFPGGIASTTLLWLRRHAPGLLRRAATVGMATTFLTHRLTGARTIDPGNAAFLGLYDHARRASGGPSAWSLELLAPAGLREAQMPLIQDGASVAGRLKPGMARTLGLSSGIEVLTGVIDTSAAFLGVGAAHGRVINVIGTTDVIAMASSRPRPDARLLTRELGAGPFWLNVYSIACGGGSVKWAHRALFPDLAEPAFYSLARRLSRRPAPQVRFRAYLAGDRMSIEQATAGFDGLDLGTTREDLLAALLHALAGISRQGITLLSRRAQPLRDVAVAGGGGWLGDLLHATWPKRPIAPWRFQALERASFLGLDRLARGETGANLTSDR